MMIAYYYISKPLQRPIYFLTSSSSSIWLISYHFSCNFYKLRGKLTPLLINRSGKGFLTKLRNVKIEEDEDNKEI